MSELLGIFSITLFFTSIIFLPTFKKTDNRNFKLYNSSFDLKTLSILIILNIILLLTLVGVKLSYINFAGYLAYSIFVLYFL